MIDKEDKFSNLVVKKRSGGTLLFEEPVFHQDDTALIVSSGSSFHCYNTQTGDLLPGRVTLASNVINIQVHPLDKTKVIGCSDRGEIVVFNTSPIMEVKKLRLCVNPELLMQRKVRLYLPENYEGQATLDVLLQQHEVRFFHFKTAILPDNKVYICATWCLDIEIGTHFSIFSFEDGLLLKHPRYASRHFQRQSKNFVFVGDKTVVGMGKNYVVALKCLKLSNRNKFAICHCVGFKEEIVCIAEHPTEKCFATGGTSGKIIIWRNIDARLPMKERLHWHSGPVKALAFSDDGYQLFSGGEETVLVKWSLHSQQKNFLPRMSSAICHIKISNNHSLIAVMTEDSKIQIINFNFANICTLQHFSSWSAINRNTSLDNIIFTVEPKTNSLVLNGKIGHLQFLSSKDQSHLLYTLDITNRNYIKTSPYGDVTTVDVTHAKFSPTGQWLVTSEIRQEENSHIEQRLKFWQFDNIKQQYSLNTNIEMPHYGEGNILALEYSRDDLVVTTGVDKKFKLWNLLEYTNLGEEKYYWSCMGAQGYRLLPCKPADFSADGSLVGVGFGPVLTVWDTTSCVLKCSLTPSFNKNALNAIKFGNQDCSHYVIVTTEVSLACWNLVTLSMMWTVPIKLSVLVNDPYSSYMAGFSANKGLHIFKPSSSQVEFQIPNCSNSQIVGAAYVLTSSSDDSFFKISQLYYINSNQELLTLEDSATSYSGVDVTGDNVTPFKLHLPEISTSDVSAIKQQYHVFNKSKTNMMNQVMRAPAHTVPPVSLICFEFLKGIALKDPENKVVQKEVNVGSSQSHHSNKKIVKEEDVDVETELSQILLNLLSKPFQ